MKAYYLEKDEVELIVDMLCDRIFWLEHAITYNETIGNKSRIQELAADLFIARATCDIFTEGK